MSNINTYIAITSSGNKMNAAIDTLLWLYLLTADLHHQMVAHYRSAQLGWESNCHSSAPPLGSALHYSRRLPLNPQLYLYSVQRNLSWEVEGHDRWLQRDEQTLALTLYLCTGNISGTANHITVSMMHICACACILYNSQLT